MSTPAAFPIPDPAWHCPLGQCLLWHGPAGCGALGCQANDLLGQLADALPHQFPRRYEATLRVLLRARLIARGHDPALVWATAAARKRLRRMAA